MYENVSDAELATVNERTATRVVCALLCGFLASLLLSEAIRAEASFTYQTENAFEEWRQAYIPHIADAFGRDLVRPHDRLR